MGSLDEVASDDGYWVVLNEDQNLEVQGLPTAPVLYGIHEGNNLISYDHATDQLIDDAFPADAVSNISAVYGQGAMAAVQDGSFAGALSTIDAGSGYWIVADEAFAFEYNEPSGDQLAKIDDVEVPEIFNFSQSSAQYFYFIEKITIQGEEINSGDWVVAYHNNVPVGARQYKKGGMIDLPIMGKVDPYFDASSQRYYEAGIHNKTANYCEVGDIPTVMVYHTMKDGSVRETEMTVKAISGSKEFAPIGHARVSLTDGLALPTEVALHNAYPNPFNPTTMIEYEIPEDMFVNLSIYDLRGRLVTELVNEMQSASFAAHQVTWNASMQASGVYFIRLIAGDIVEHQKIMLIK